ncbi:hypothetical protein F0521_40610 [Ferrimonas sp. YFM]|nr:DUF3019 domain-containing protein [Ferrimonas sp. YFM]BDY07020.1 hypothetical protein F0521_40610 [Ferrimonas sp. YFM]
MMTIRTLCCSLMLMPLSALGMDSPVQFTATPERCIALHKGQLCYQDVEFNWQTPESGRFCLMQARDRQQLLCWTGRSRQNYLFSFEGDKTTRFSLIREGEPVPLAEVKVEVTWVYKAPRQSRSGWRLF